MQSLVIIVAIDSILLTLGGIGTELENEIILDEIPGGCKSAARLERYGPKSELLDPHNIAYTASTPSSAVRKGDPVLLLFGSWRGGECGL
jgi:hypothetical protein